MATFDFHFHLLFKHYFTGQVTTIDNPIKTNGFAALLNDVLGGPFDSQSSPAQIVDKDCDLVLGVANILSMEHAFANRILHILGLDLSGKLPVDKDLVNRTKNGLTSYFDEYKAQVIFHQKFRQHLQQKFGINFLDRRGFENKSLVNIKEELIRQSRNGLRNFAFAMEGGHNLSKEKIRKGIDSLYPELSLKELQDDPQGIDLMLMNLCHLSYIPEQKLGGFAQGLNSLAQIAFSSDDFMPTVGLGLTELGKRVIREAYFHERPVLIDVKHMSVHTRFQFYRFREKLIEENEDVKKLPIISSHTGFTFMSLKNFLEEKSYRIITKTKHGKKFTGITAENKRLAKMDYLLNRGLFGNPWTINLFDEEIVEIMRSGGLIGISLDQRLMGASNPGIDSARDKYFQDEFIAEPEWNRMFKQGLIPEEKPVVEGIAPTKEERHSMLFCLHLVHAIRVGKIGVAWPAEKSPWDCICIGSDFDGLVNPINGIDDVTKYGRLREQIMEDLPEADRILKVNDNVKALRYHNDGTIDKAFLLEVVDKFMFGNGLTFTARFLTNWNDLWQNT